MIRTDSPDVSRPGAWARFRSRQSGCPSGPIGRLFGRLMVPTTAPANDAAIDARLEQIPGATDLTKGVLQANTSVAYLAAVDKEDILDQLAKASVQVDPRFGSFDPDRAAFVMKTPNWIVPPAAPTGPGAPAQ